MTNLEDALGEIDVLAAADTTDAAPTKSALDDKINEHFAGAVVRKDLVKAVRGNAVVPSYVLEYLLGQYAASDDEATIQAGIDSVRQVLPSPLICSTDSESGRTPISIDSPGRASTPMRSKVTALSPVSRTSSRPSSAVCPASTCSSTLREGGCSPSALGGGVLRSLKESSVLLTYQSPAAPVMPISIRNTSGKMKRFL